MSNNKSLDGFNRINNVVLNNTEVNGVFVPHNNQLIDIGTSIKKFNNIYANDIVLSSGSVISDLNSLQSQINNITNATSGGLDVIATNGDFINITTDNLVVSSITSSSILTNNIDSINSTIDNILSSNITSTNALITNVSTPNLRFSNYINPIFVTQGSYGVKVNGLTIILNTKGELATNNSNFLISKPFLSGITPKQEPVSVGKLTEVLDLIGLSIEDLSDLLGIDQDILSDMQTIGLNVDTNQFKFKNAGTITDPLATKLTLNDDDTTARRALFFDENSKLKTNNYLKISDTAQYDGKYIELSSVTITDAIIDTTNIKTTNLTASNFKVEEVTASNLLVNTKLKTLELQVDGDTNIQANTTISNLYTSNITSGNLTATNITTGGLSLTNLISNSFTSSNIRTENITASNIFVNTKLQTLELEVDGNCKIDSNTTISNLNIPQNLTVSGSGSIGSLVVPNSFNSQAVSITGGARLTNIGTGLEYSGNNLQIKLNAGTGISVSGNTITNDLNDDVTNLKTDMTTVKADITGIKGVNTTQDTALAVLAAFQATQTLVVNTEFGARISNCETSIGNLSSSVSSNTTSINNLNTSVGNLKTQVDNYGSSIGSLNTSVGSLKTQVDNYGSSIGSLNTSVGSLKTQVDNYGSSIGSLNTSVGSLKTQVDNYGNSIGSLNTSVGNLITKVNGYQTSFSTSNLLATNGTIGNIFTTGGNVGINTTSPSYRLDVGGDINLTGNYYKNGVLFSGGGESVWGTSGNNIFYTKGNVGIGTTSPSYLLHVSGGSAFNGIISSSNLSVSDTISTANIVASTSLSGFRVLGTLYTSGYILNNNDIYVVGSLNVTGESSFKGAITSSNIAIGNSITTGYAIINNEEVKVNLTHPLESMNDYNSNLYEATESSSGVVYPVWKMFDGNSGPLSTPWNSASGGYNSSGNYIGSVTTGTNLGTYNGEWFGLRLKNDTFVLKDFSINGYTGSLPNDLIILGNNTTSGASWTVITTLGNLSYGDINTINNFTISNTLSYSNYRFVVPTIGGAVDIDIVVIYEFSLGGYRRYTTTINGGITTGFINVSSITAGNINITGASVFTTLTAGSINITGASSFGVGITGGSINITGASSFGVGITGGSLNITGGSNFGVGITGGSLNITGASSLIFNSNTIGNIITTGGNVGIGTVSPKTRLHLEGANQSMNGPHITFTTSADTTYPVFQQVAWGRDASYLLFDSYLDNGIIKPSSTKTAYHIGKYSDRLLINYQNGSAGSSTTSLVGIAVCSTGNVGIGLNTASYKLDVLGTSNFSDLITASTLSILNITSGILIANTGITGGSINITGGSSFGGLITASNLSINNITVANLNAASIAFAGLTTGSLRVTGASSLIFNSNTIANIITTGGNVGIGGIPSGALHVIMGDANAAGSIANWGNNYAVFGQSSNTGGAIGIGYNNASGGSLSCLSPSVSWRSMSYLAVQHIFYQSNTEIMRINTAGNVGIGTSAPTQIVHIQKSGTDNYLKIDAGDTGANSKISGIMLSEFNINYGWSLRHNAGSDDFRISYQDNTPTFTDLMTFIRTSGGNVGVGISPTHKLQVDGALKLSSNPSVTNDNNAAYFWNQSGVGPTIAGNAFEVKTGGDNSRMRISDAGTIRCNRTDDSGANGVLQVKSSGNGKLQDGASFQASNDNNWIIGFLNTAGTTRGKIAGNGSNNVTYDTSSDKRLKKDIIDLPEEYGVQTIKTLRPVKYKWKSDNTNGYGFVAQDVYNVLPHLRPSYDGYCECECGAENMVGNPLGIGLFCSCQECDVDEPVDKEGNAKYYGLDYGLFTPYLTKALQESIARIEQLEADNRRLMDFIKSKYPDEF